MNFTAHGLRHGSILCTMVHRLGIPLALVMILTGAGCASDASDDQDTGGLFAYRTDRELVLASTSKPIARIAVGPDESPAVDFTNALDFVFTVSGREIVGATAGSEPLQPIHCDCTRAFPLSGSKIVWWQQPNVLMSADLDRALPPQILRTVTLPDPRDPLRGQDAVLDETEVVAVSPLHIMLNRPEHRPGEWQTVNHLYSVDLSNGAIRQYGAVPQVNTRLRGGTHVLLDHATGPRAPDHFYALGEIRTDATRADVVVDIDTDTGTITSTTPEAGAPLVNLRGESGGIAVTALSSTATGATPTIWHLRDGTWNRPRDTPLLETAALTDSATLDLVPADSGRMNLWLNRTGGAKQLAENVVSIAVAPSRLRL